MMKPKEKYENFIKNEVLFESRCCGKFKIIEYLNGNDVTVEFVETNYTTKTTSAAVRRGDIRDYWLPTVFGVGIMDIPNATKDPLKKAARIKWQSMLTRCYSSSYQNKYPTYKGCAISESFKRFSSFLEWYISQVGFNQEGWHLDKDILGCGKVYSPQTCCVIPNEINVALASISSKHNTKNKFGISRRKNGRFAVYAHCGSINKYLGIFDTLEEAFKAYKQAKESRIKELTNKWKDQIDPRVYEELMNYKVEI